MGQVPDSRRVIRGKQPCATKVVESERVMTIVAEAAELPPRHGQLAAMALGALGVVYGDIGTSPLYTFKTAFEWAGGEASPMAALEAFLADKTRTRRTNTAANHRDRLTRHFRFTCQLDEVTHADILRSLGRIPTSPEHDHALSCVKTLFTWAHNRRYITDNPTVGIQPHGSQSRSRILTDEELSRVFASADQFAQFGTVVKLLVLTGLRRGECADIRKSWISEKEKMLVVPSTIAKTGEERTIPLGELSSQE